MRPAGARSGHPATAMRRASLAVALLCLVQAQAAPGSPPPGRMIEMGGYRMHLLTAGEGQAGPTVVFFHGAGDVALHWNLVLPAVGAFAQAVAIDQNGEGWSEHGHGAALNQQVRDSRAVLERAGFAPPYIVVGHSLGGLLAHMFAAEYRDEVSGAVLVEATHPDVVLRVLNQETREFEWKRLRLTADGPIPPVQEGAVAAARRVTELPPRRRDLSARLHAFSPQEQQLFEWLYNERMFSYVEGQSDTFEAEIFERIHANRKAFHLGYLPLIVISAGGKPAPKGDSNWDTASLVDHSHALQNDLLNLSYCSEKILAPESGHDVHLDAPELVVGTIRRMISRQACIPSQP